jgi:hypothetical protein
MASDPTGDGALGGLRLKTDLPVVRAAGRGQLSSRPVSSFYFTLSGIFEFLPKSASESVFDSWPASRPVVFAAPPATRF